MSQVDGTYKTNFNNFSLVSFGRGKINPKYYFVFLSFFNKEENEDCVRLFKAFTIYAMFSILILCKFLMQDACRVKSFIGSIA